MLVWFMNIRVYMYMYYVCVCVCMYLYMCTLTSRSKQRVLFCCVLFNKLVPYLIAVVKCVPVLRRQYSKTITLMLQLGNGCSCFITYGHPSGGRISLLCRQSNFILANFFIRGSPVSIFLRRRNYGIFFE